MLAAAFLSMAAATASQAFHQFGVHELKEFCLRRNRKDWFTKIVNEREWMTLGADSTRVLATVVAVCSAMTWFLPHGASELSTIQWVRIVSAIIIALLIVNSWVPFAVSQFAASYYLFHTWRIWWCLSLLTWPLISGSRVFAGLLRRAVGADESEHDEEEWLEEEIRSMVSEGEQDGLLEADERDMIEGVMELDEKDVFGIMTPRSKVDALDINTEWSTAVQFVVASGRTRVPVYNGRLDNIVGILFAKDLLRESLQPENRRRPLEKLLREPLTVPESILLNEMLQKFLREYKHLAIVMDEYGAFSGIVSIEDILEEIVGEIVDETDREEPHPIQLIEHGLALIEGAARVDEINEALGIEIPEDEDYDTIAGYVMHTLKKIPAEGFQFAVDNVRITLMKASLRTIESVELLVLTDDQVDENEIKAMALMEPSADTFDESLQPRN